MPHYTEITRKLRSVHATNIEAATLIEELVKDLDKAKDMLLEAREAYTAETQSTMEMAKRIMELEAENENCRLAMCRYGAAFAADTLSGVIVRTIEVLDAYRKRAADEMADGKPGGQEENVKVMAHPLARANVDRGVKVEIRWKHGKQRG
jgi:hypothetical protein